MNKLKISIKNGILVFTLSTLFSCYMMIIGLFLLAINPTHSVLVKTDVFGEFLPEFIMLMVSIPCVVYLFVSHYQSNRKIKKYMEELWVENYNLKLQTNK
jgi:hypothetical protein